MKNRRSQIKTKNLEIIDYWETRVDECDISVDFSYAHERCWRCGYKSVLHRCHIIPHSLGGEDHPSNLVLLCKRCHVEAPNINDVEFFWDWLKAQKTSFYNTYWTIRGFIEYEQIYKEDIILALFQTNLTYEDLKVFLEENIKNTAIHFGEGRINPSTIAGLIRKYLKKRAESISANDDILKSISQTEKEEILRIRSFLRLPIYNQ